MTEFKLGDRVEVIPNDGPYGAYAGQQGVVDSVNHHEGAASEVFVFLDGRTTAFAWFFYSDELAIAQAFTTQTEILEDYSID